MNHRKLFLLPALFLLQAIQPSLATGKLQPARLFVTLPDYCPTPDALAVAPDGSLTLSCPNYADKACPGVIVSIRNGTVSKLAEVPGARAGTPGRPMGIAYGPDGALYANADGQLLRLTFVDGKLANTEVIAFGMQGPNGLRYHDGCLYVTLPRLPGFGTAMNTGGVYRFRETDRNIAINNDASDTNLIFSIQTQNPDKQFGLDGLDFDREGNLLVADFGDAVIYKLQLNSAGRVEHHEVYADLQTTGIDGMVFDGQGNLFVAGFSRNQILKVTADRKVVVVAEYPDNDGANGELDQPVDLVIHDGKLVVSNFDLMAEPGMVNTKHSKPYTLSFIELADIQ